MAEEFQAEVCGESWWSSPRATFNIGNYGGCWQNDFMNLKTRSTDGGCSPDSAFQIISSSTASTTASWSQALLVNGRNEESYNQTLTEIMNNNLPADGQNSSNNLGMEQEHTSSFMTTSGDCTASCGYPSSLLLSPPPPYDFQANLNEFDPVSSMAGYVKPKQQITGGLHKTPFWNAPPLDLNDNRPAFFASDCRNIKSQNEQIRDLGSSAKKCSATFNCKRPRLETPSPLPTFKVRKEKLGDRVTALQQLVSPFGKTDTASVLHEAIEYIKLLHDQVNVLSAPYMKNGATKQMQQTPQKVKDSREGAKQQDLRSRGLCLVPVSVTFPVATETAPDYWTSSFGSTFK